MVMKYENEPMLEVYMFETTQLIDRIEQIVIESEKRVTFTDEEINEIFRCMHTIKGSSAMMLFDTIATVAHKMEDLFYFIREKKPKQLDFSSLSDMVLSGVDFMKVEVTKIRNNDDLDGSATDLLTSLDETLSFLKAKEGEAEKPTTAVDEKIQYYIAPEKKSKVSGDQCLKVHVMFQEGCEMENIRAYTVVFGLTDRTEEIYHVPTDLTENEFAAQIIREKGFELYLRTTESIEALKAYFESTVFMKHFELQRVDDTALDIFRKKEEPLMVQETPAIKVPALDKPEAPPKETAATGQHMISVHVEKLDKLMNMVGELVISEAMVTQNPEALRVESESYHKASRQLHKITGELQDMVMAIRMVPLSTTFIKMHRIVRDMCKRLSKDVVLEISGETTEVDKNIIEHISDPFIHIIRNAIDHGIEDQNIRASKGKDPKGRIFLDAQNVGSDVVITIRDDGKGLDKEKIIQKAQKHGLLNRNPEDMSDREIYSIILLPGFSTKDEVSEFSGRGVGMDVVVKKLEAVGGLVFVESEKDKGTTITMKIPLTLAIIEGMNLKVGESRYTLPLTAIKESFRPKTDQCLMDPDNNEMIMVRGECYPILRLHQLYKVKHAVTELDQGILIMVEQDSKRICLFADELIGQQQVVVKSLPSYILNIKKTVGLAGCTLLGDGSISLIMDIAGLAGLRIR